MRFPRRLVFALSALALGACTTSSPVDPPAADAGQSGPRECAPACKSWEECDDGTCRAAANRCSADRDCPSFKPVCDVSTHRCTEDVAECTGCLAWQTCSAGACVAASGRCGKDTDCGGGGFCNLTSNTCVANACSPACAEWQTCSGRTCALTAGRCVTNAECTSPAAPFCNTATHACEPPPADQPKALVHAGLIVTSDALKAPFEELARFHTLTGIPTRVVTVQQICAATTCSTTDARRDKARAVKDYIHAQRDVSIVVLGGDIEHVPTRWVYDEFENALLGVAFAEEFPSDYYFADGSSWNDDGDEEYAEMSGDYPDLVPEKGVTRIPVSTVAEAGIYVDKVVSHVTDYPLSRVLTALLLSNVATTFTVPVANLDVPIDGAVYYVIEGRTESLLPTRFQKTKLYAVPPARVEQLTLARQIEEMERSHNLIVHNGHGWVNGVTSEIDGTKQLTGEGAAALENTHYPFFLSCACDAGKFSANDSAGERIVTAPRGGAIGYMGNAATGLGLAGGAQMVDEFLRYTFSVPRAYVGDAVRTAHLKLPANDTIPVAGFNVPVVDADSWDWTQKGVVYLGDGLIPVWTDGTLAYAPDVTVTRSAVGSASRVKFTFSRAVTNATLRVMVGASTYELTANGLEATLTLPTAPARLSWGLQSSTTLSAWGDEAF